ncbi:hypothetical protein ABID22_002835 [Pontibacter aydingkolensis]|uniref:DUF2721 domain-containing protein n=1 Tax=Pontibacter aydingkolensis TaxID=1911536 RepID=A0ABS7CX37_9BACT|nr:DUF2721 domain-containing protein [Pontibacter aydingkolensis]MBW7468423.1 DUF2721 domain-containing protein [Pontibacter aydingkolensis]
MVTLTVLSAMITPVVLILATGQLILTTSQRLARSVERARKLSEQFEHLVQQETSVKNTEKKELLYLLLHKAAHRSRKLQRAMSLLYVSLSVFVGTSVSIGILEALDLLVFWVPVGLGLIGAGLLFYATILLIAETRLALSAIDKEMDYLIKNYANDLPKESNTKEQSAS